MFLNQYTPAEMETLQPGSFFLIDIRSENDFEYGHIPDAVNIPEDNLSDGIAQLPQDKLILLCCRDGRDSTAAAARLREVGVNAAALDTGYYGWMRHQLQQGDHAERAEMSIRKKFRKALWTQFAKAVRTYDLVQPGDRIAVCISGGKDSMLMAKLFQELQWHRKFPFEVVYLVMDPGYSPVNREILEMNARALNVPITVFDSSIFDAVYMVEKNPCYLCARMRRGYLYSHARDLGCNKIALGHHYDDVIETILMGMLYGGQVQTMMPKLHSTNFPGMELIRPMYLIREDDIKRWRDYNGLHFLQCACRFTEVSASYDTESNPSKRKEVKDLIRRMHEINPQVEANIFRSVENVNLQTIIAYKDDHGRHHFMDDY